MHRIVWSMLLLICLFCFSVESPFSRNVFTSWTTIDGLPSNRILSIATGPKGEVWVGTDGGVARFDGRTWKAYTVDDTLLSSYSLISNEIHSIAVDTDGSVWCVAQYSLCHFDEVSWSIQKDGSSGNTFLCNTVAVTPDGTLYAGAIEGLYRFVNGKWIAQSEMSDIFSIDRVIFAPDGTGWAGGKWNLLYYNGYKWEVSSVRERWDEAIVPLTYGPDGAMWFNRFVVLRCPEGAICPAVIQWESKGIAKLDKAGWTYFENLFGKSAATDIYGAVWIGSYRGLTRFDGTTWKTYTTADGLPCNSVRAVAVDAEGTVWCGTDQGVSRFRQIMTGVVNESEIPRGICIFGNHPNPFNPSTSIEFSLPAPGAARLAVYDITGRTVRELLSASLSAGKHSVVWDGKDGAGRPSASGVYFSRLECGGRMVTAKLLLMR